jgi:hypothetical protein
MDFAMLWVMISMHIAPFVSLLIESGISVDIDQLFSIELKPDV